MVLGRYMYAANLQLGHVSELQNNQIEFGIWWPNTNKFSYYFPTFFGPISLFFFLLFSREEYKTMKWQWQSMTKTQENNFSEFRERKHLVGKEVQNVMGTLQHLNFLVHVASIYLLQKDTDEANIL